MWASVRERIHTHSNMCAKGRLKNAWGNVWNTRRRCGGVLQYIWSFLPLYLRHFYGELAVQNINSNGTTSAIKKEPNREPERCNINFCDTSSAQSSILWLTSSKFREFWNTKSTKARFKMADNLTKRDLWRARLSLSRTTCGGYLPVSTHRRCYPQPSWMLLHYKP